ncbi:MAG: ShlB/FhaC/HecB family hemolysin secretion/activation protein [Verrucomicrobiales bacterium]|nr:ShlB/FhaC/HecB family hemolysin secretion/activation protein [Verrucomicrobiales bacterium]
MKKLASTLLTGILLVCTSGPLHAQDSELGVLPPIPNLDLGDPDRKLSWREKRRLNNMKEEERYANSVYRRTDADTGGATLGQRLMRGNQRAEQRTFPTEIDVNNVINSHDDAMTASGARLKPFGEENEYWAGMPEALPEEELVILPPMPDLRTPDQVTRKERMRNARVAKYESRKAELELKRREKEIADRATVDQPPVDPSTALVQVESQQMNGTSYIGNQEAPEKVNSQGNLKPFNEQSSYYKDNQLVYKGNQPTNSVKFWWKKGTTEPGGGNPDAPKVQWENPFTGNRDDVQPVSFTQPDGGGGYAAGSPTLDATPLTSNLQGIRVVDSTRDVNKTGGGGITGVVSEGVDLPPRVLEVLQSRVNSSLTLGGLNQMVREAVVAYRRSDLPVVDVLVPEQEITSGVLQLVIIEGRLGDVLVEGAAGKIEGRALASQIRTERGDVIRESKLTEDLAWINKHPTRQVDLIFSPGDEYGETDVILRSQAYKELSAYIAYENSGTAALGESRALFGTSWTGPLFFGLDSILSYQFTTNFDNSDADLQGHSGVFAQYLPWRHQITLLGAYVDSNALLPNGNGLINTGGVNKQLSGRYSIPLPNIGRLTHELELGMDFKSSNSGLTLVGANPISFDSTSEIVQYSLGYNIVASDNSGVWRVDTEVVNSPGQATSKNTDAIFASQRGGALASYTYGRVLIERDQKLANEWSLLARLQGQMSNGNLLASESMGAGGYDTVRGFEQRIIRGDNGVVGTLELRTPTVYPSTFTGYNNVQDGAFGLLFYDAAALSSEDPFPGEPDLNAGSIGLGFRYQREEWFTLRVDYGFQVTEDGFEDGNNGRWHVGARATF